MTVFCRRFPERLSPFFITALSNKVLKRDFQPMTQGTLTFTPKPKMILLVYIVGTLLSNIYKIMETF